MFSLRTCVIVLHFSCGCSVIWLRVDVCSLLLLLLLLLVGGDDDDDDKERVFYLVAVVVSLLLFAIEFEFQLEFRAFG